MAGGIIVLGGLVVLLFNTGAIGEAMQPLGVTSGMLVVSLLFLGVLAGASGIGMWKGTTWGWWLATLYYMYSIVRNASALLTILVSFEQLGGAPQGPEYYVFKHGGRIIVHALLLGYFLKTNVLDYFGLAGVAKFKAVGYVFGVCALLTLVASIVSLIGG